MRNDVSHIFVSDKDGDEMWLTEMMESRETSSVTFNQTGIFRYHGNPGTWITGTIIVLEK